MFCQCVAIFLLTKYLNHQRIFLGLPLSQLIQPHVHAVTINAYNPDEWGLRVAFARQPRRQPTGYYLSAGSVGEVIVPAELVDRGYSILVGAHTADHKDKRDPKRLDRVSTRFEIINAKTKIANPLGGGVYIEVPNRETLGPREIQLRGVIKSPLYSLRDFDKTTAEEWLTQRGHPGPWADFVSDKFMMQVPTSWIYAFDEPEELMNKWDLGDGWCVRVHGHFTQGPKQRGAVPPTRSPSCRHSAFWNRVPTSKSDLMILYRGRGG